MTLFRDQNPILGPNASVELGNGMGASTITGLQLFEVFPFSSVAAPAGQSQVLFIVPPAASTATATLPLGQYIFLGAQLFYTTASTSGTLRFFHDTGTQSPGGGTAITASTTLATAGPLTLAIPMSTGLAQATQVFSAGDRLSFTLAGTLTNLANFSFNVYMARVSAGVGQGLAY